MNDVFGAVHAAVQTVENNPILNISIFGAFVAVTLFIVIRASRNNKTAADYYAAGRSFTGPQNGFAISGDYLSAASFLGITGAIAINGYDGFLYSIGFLVAWLVALLLVAELMRNTGKFTMADVLSFRLKQRPVRMAAAITTLAVCFFYLLAQMAGAGGLVSLLLGIDEPDRPVDRGRRRRRPDDRLRARRRDEGHDLGADRQGVPAHRRRARHDDLGARDQRVQPQHAARERRRGVADRPEGRDPRARPAVRREPVGLHLARDRAGARHGGPAARADALLHGADRQGGSSLGGVGDLADRALLPADARARLRRRRARRPGGDPGGAGWRELGGTAARPRSSADRSCSASSRRSRSRRSSRSSPASRSRRRRRSRTTSTRTSSRRATSRRTARSRSLGARSS